MNALVTLPCPGAATSTIWILIALAAHFRNDVFERKLGALLGVKVQRRTQDQFTQAAAAQDLLLHLLHAAAPSAC